jgi:hypothetical protein
MPRIEFCKLCEMELHVGKSAQAGSDETRRVADSCCSYLAFSSCALRLYDADVLRGGLRSASTHREGRNRLYQPVAVVGQASGLQLRQDRQDFLFRAPDLRC